MGFILDGLESEAYDRTYRDRDLLGRIAGYFRPHARQMGFIAVALTLNSIAGTGGPILISRALDIVSPRPDMPVIWLLTAGVLLLGVSAWVFNLIQQWLSARVIGSVVLKLREDVFAATIRHDLSFYDAHPSGKIVSRVTSDTQDFSDVVSLATNLLSQILLIVVMSVWLLRIDSGLVFMLWALTPFVVGIALGFRRIARQVTQHARRVTAKINAQIQESVSGIVVAKSFRQERAIYDTFNLNNRQAYHVGLRRGLTINTVFPILGMTTGIASALLLYFGGLATRTSGITPGNWYLFLQAAAAYTWPLIQIASFWSQFQDGLSAAERVFALIDAEPKVMQTGNEPVPQVGGHIEFRHLRLSYTGSEVVLPDFSLDIRPRETVALVGHTGAGKTSVARLTARFYEFQGGDLLIDGRDVRRLDLGQYRRHIGIVPQEPFLFSGTVRDNIRYGQPDASDDAVLQAAIGIGNGDWLAVLPNGLDTDVGERGANLSMGQRQLVALARVLCKNPAIFILDEATASVDPFTETQIQEGLDAVMRDRTAIVIAHRLSTVRHADRIIVMQNGRIIEEGTHESLLAQGGHYGQLYDAYFRHQAISYIDNFQQVIADQ